MNLQQLVQNSEHSALYLRLLNIILWKKIPFNSPHRFRILKIKGGEIELLVPYRKSNLNHINSIHACALATASEYASGLSLSTLLPEGEYRIIMKSLSAEYFYQGKKDVTIRFQLDKNFIKDILDNIPEATGSGLIHTEVNSFDSDGNHISTCMIEWQVKKWSHVKTKI